VRPFSKKKLKISSLKSIEREVKVQMNWTERPWAFATA